MLRMTILNIIARAMGLDLSLEVPVAQAANGGPARPSLDDHPGVQANGRPATFQARQPKQPQKPRRSPWWTAKETAEYLDVHPATVCKWAAAGKLPGERRGGSLVFHGPTIRAWKRSQRIVAASRPATTTTPATAGQRDLFQEEEETDGRR